MKENTKTKFREAKNNIKKFVIEHKRDLITGAVTVTGFAIGCYASYKCCGLISQSCGVCKGTIGPEPLRGNDCLEPLGDASLERAIDEDIFTKLAPAIETAVMDSKLEKTHICESYYLGDLVHKLVEIDITQVVGD